MRWGFFSQNRLGILFLAWLTILGLIVFASSPSPRFFNAPPSKPGQDLARLRLERFIPVETAPQEIPREDQTNLTPGSEDWHGADQLDTLPRPLVALDRLLVFPEKAILLGIKSALVLAEIDLDPRGRVTACRIVLGAGNGFDDEVLAKLPQVRFSPGRLAGQPVAVRARLPIRFVLKRHS